MSVHQYIDSGLSFYVKYSTEENFRVSWQ